MFQSACLMGPDLQLPEILVSQDLPERSQGLLKDFLPVSHKEQFCLAAVFIMKPFEIESGDHRFACARGGNHQILPSVMKRSLPV